MDEMFLFVSDLFRLLVFFFFFFNDTATTEIYTLSLHDALPISRPGHRLDHRQHPRIAQAPPELGERVAVGRHRADTDLRSLAVERLPVKTLAAEIQSDVQHAMGLPSSYRGRTEFPSAGGPPSSDSVAPIGSATNAPCVLASLGA